MPDKFVPLGAVIVVPGVIQNEAGENIGSNMQLNLDGKCKELIETREGLAELQSLLCEAVKIIGQRMCETPNALTKASGVVKATSLPPMPKGFKAGGFH